MLPLLFEVVQSWQVIAVTIAIFFYFSIVSYTARTHHRRRIANPYNMRPKKKKKVPVVPVATAPENDEDPNDELGLESD